MSSITYHFGGKEGLYLAAAEYIADTMRERLRPIGAALEGRTACEAQAARVVLHKIVAQMAEVLISHETARFAQFIVREQAPTEAFRPIL